jgi:hypothetical protein
VSEYQYYEFLAVDGPISDEGLRYARACSSRAQVSRVRWHNVYHFGDFHGKAETLLNHYDAHFHIANWGTVRLGLAFPEGSLAQDAIQPYLRGGERYEKTLALQKIGKRWIVWWERNDAQAALIEHFPVDPDALAVAANLSHASTPERIPMTTVVQGLPVIDLKLVRPDAEKATKASLLTDVKRFEKASLAGEYYESFAVNSRNCTQQSAGTSSWIATFLRFLHRCVTNADTPEAAATVQASVPQIDINRAYGDACRGEFRFVFLVLLTKRKRSFSGDVAEQNEGNQKNLSVHLVVPIFLSEHAMHTSPVCCRRRRPACPAIGSDGICVHGQRAASACGGRDGWVRRLSRIRRIDPCLSERRVRRRL